MLEAVRTITQAEEDFKERKGLGGGGPSGARRGKKWKFTVSTTSVTAKCVKKQYTSKAKVDYKGKKAGERRVKKEGAVAPAGEVTHTVWAEAHKGVDQKVVDQRKSDKVCTQFGLRSHAWKYGRKPVRVSVVYRGPAKLKRQALLALRQCPQVATVALDGQGESSRRVVRRPPAWAFEDDKIL